MPRTLRLSLLGPFEARWSDGEPAELASRKASALLAYLAVERGRPHPREQLATLLWSDTGEERARHNLRQGLSRIRRSCGPVIVSHGDALQFDPATCTTDVEDFERLSASDDPDELRECLRIYRGDLLDGLLTREAAYEEWLLVARRRYRNLACGAADRWTSSLEAQGRIPEAIEALNLRLAMDPACEPAHLLLMRLLVRAGRRSDALRQYQACEEALARELGAEPGAEAKDLFLSLRRDESALGDAGVRPPPPAAPRTEDGRPTVAVLPFENLTTAEDAYFVDGIAEDIITALSCFKSLFVIARGTSFSYRGRDIPEREIAAEIGAQYLVRGSVQRAGRRVRINVQLLDAQEGQHLWGHRYDRDMEDVFLVQDEISSTVVSTLAGRVEAARLERARRAPAERLDAYDFVLRGKEYHHRYTPEDCARCIDMFQRAIERDPDYAVAHAWLACGLGQAMGFRLDEKDKLVDQSQAAAERGLELDQNESECHRILAQVFLTRRNHKRSLWHQERALFLNPNDDRSVCAMGEILAFIGRPEEAEEWVRRSMRLNPCHPARYWTHLARALFHQGRFAESLDALDRLRQPRLDDLAYSAAASARLEDGQQAGRRVAELRKAHPRFDPAAFVASLPYEREAERRELLDALRQAGAGDTT